MREGYTRVGVLRRSAQRGSDREVRETRDHLKVGIAVTAVRICAAKLKKVAVGAGRPKPYRLGIVAA